MNNFSYCNPVRVEFGKGAISRLPECVPHGSKVLMCYGGGSIKRNGVHDQVLKALADYEVIEFGGIEPNPRYETLMKAVEIGRKESVDFILAVGGGSVLDGVKFIAAAIDYPGGDPWSMLSPRQFITEAKPLGCVMTLPATGSEMNGFSVISRDSTQEKLPFGGSALYPKFSILDPETTYSLPERQTRNGIIDSFVHVMEQYCTRDLNTPLQDRQAEAVLLTLIEEGPKVMGNPKDYDTRANIMWAATCAFNGLINCGTIQDWSTHMIGHEITALWGIDHAQTLAIVLPANLRHRAEAKRDKLLRYARAVWGVDTGSDEERIDRAIEMTEDFFQMLGAATRLSECDVTDDIMHVADRLETRGNPLGENGEVTPDDVRAILELCR